jgi:4-aminobutyrate aminotransferase
LRRLQALFPRLADLRGLGLMVGAELSDPETRAPLPELAARLEQRAFAKGLLLLQCGKSTLRFAPPLVIEEAHVDTALAIFEACLQEESGQP